LTNQIFLLHAHEVWLYAGNAIIVIEKRY